MHGKRPEGAGAGGNLEDNIRHLEQLLPPQVGAKTGTDKDMVDVCPFLAGHAELVDSGLCGGRGRAPQQPGVS